MADRRSARPRIVVVEISISTTAWKKLMKLRKHHSSVSTLSSSNVLNSEPCSMIGQL